MKHISKQSKRSSQNDFLGDVSLSLNMTGYFGHFITFSFTLHLILHPLSSSRERSDRRTPCIPFSGGCFASLNMTGLSRDIPSLFSLTLLLTLHHLSSLREVLYGPTEGSSKELLSRRFFFRLLSVRMTIACWLLGCDSS